jgi:hypothetical protein
MHILSSCNPYSLLSYVMRNPLVRNPRPYPSGLLSTQPRGPFADPDWIRWSRDARYAEDLLL